MLKECVSAGHSHHPCRAQSNGRTPKNDPSALAAGSEAAGAFWTSPSGLYMRSQGQQIHLGFTDETIFELFERAVSFKRFLVHFGMRVN